MVPDDIEREARGLERRARAAVHLAAHDLDRAETFRRLAEGPDLRAAHYSARAAGLAFRAAELRYDARGGMTAALERRRLEPGAMWEHLAAVVRRLDVRWVDKVRGLVRLRVDGTWSTMQSVPCAEMTRANGWLFLGLSDQGGYR